MNFTIFSMDRRNCVLTINSKSDWLEIQRQKCCDNYEKTISGRTSVSAVASWAYEWILSESNTIWNWVSVLTLGVYQNFYTARCGTITGANRRRRMHVPKHAWSCVAGPANVYNLLRSHGAQSHVNAERMCACVSFFYLYLLLSNTFLCCRCGRRCRQCTHR